MWVQNSSACGDAVTFPPMASVSDAKVVFISCLGLGWGGPKVRCYQAAALLSGAGTPAACVELERQQCVDGEKEPWRLLARKAGVHLIFLKELPPARLLTTLRRNACTLTLDQMDDCKPAHSVSKPCPSLTPLLSHATAV
jgi:hypothetical protein